MSWKTNIAAIPLALGLAFAMTDVSAAFCYQGRPGTTESGPELDMGVNGPTTDDVKFSVSGPLQSADDCSAVYAGNLTPIQEEELINAIWGPGFEHVVKTDGNDSETGTLDGLTFEVEQLSAGEWELTVTGLEPNQSIELDFVAVFKQSQGLGAWLFEDVVFSDADGNGEGTFVLRWCSGNPVSQNNPPSTEPACAQTQTSHLSILAGAPDTPTENPEPATLLLFGIGLAGLALTQRRRRRSI